MHEDTALKEMRGLEGDGVSELDASLEFQHVWKQVEERVSKQALRSRCCPHLGKTAVPPFCDITKGADLHSNVLILYQANEGKYGHVQSFLARDTAREH